MAKVTDIVDAVFLLHSLDKEQQQTYVPIKNEPVIGSKDEKQILKIGNGEQIWDELPSFNSEIFGSDTNLEPGQQITRTFASNYFEYGTPAYISKDSDNIVTEYIDGKIVSGIAYRFWLDDSNKPGSADYTKNQITEALGKASIAIGCDNHSLANYSATFGTHNKNNGYGAFAGGGNNILTILEGNNGKTKNSQYATAFGYSVGTVGAASFSSGTGDSAISNFVQSLTASNSKEEVYNEWIALNRGKRPSVSWGDWSARFGSYNISIGNNSFVAGGYNAAVGDCSAAFGTDTFALHNFSFVCGSYNLVDWKESFAAGSNNKVYDQRSFIGGGYNIAGIKGRCAEKEEEEKDIPEGERTIIGYNAIFGQNNSALSTHGFISGYNNTIAEVGTTHSGVIGMGNYIGYGGYYSLVAGLNNVSYNNGAMILGGGLISSAPYGLTVGRLNKEVSNGLFVVGNGTGNVQDCTINRETNKINYNGATPSNAFVVYSDGHAEVASDNINNDNSIPKMGTMKTKLAEIETEFANWQQNNNFNIETSETSGINRYDESFSYTAEWTKLNINGLNYQTTGLITVTNSSEEDSVEFSGFWLSNEDYQNYKQHFKKAIVSFNGCSSSSEGRALYVYWMPWDDDDLLTVGLNEPITLGPRDNVKFTLQFII